MPKQTVFTKSPQRLAFLVSLLFQLVPILSFSQGSQVTTGSELKRLYAVEQLPVYLPQTGVEQISSYDRKGGNNDGFEGTYSFLSKTENGLVVFEAEGKGILERIWTPTPTEDTLDFYFDKKPTPAFSIKYSDLFSGKVFPFLAPVVGHKVGGFYSYLPIPFTNGCRIVFRGKRILFHQFQYRKLGEQYQVQTFRPELDPQAKEQLQAIVARWSQPTVSVADLYKATVQTKTTRTVLQPGQSAVLAELKSGGRIVGIEVEDASAFEGLENAVDIKLTWDNEKQPAVFAPVADFFGFAFGKKSMKSLLMGVDSANRAYCFLPMPFDRSAKVEMIYRKGSGRQKPVRIKATISYQSTARKPEREGRFYASWKQEVPALGQPYVFLEGKGKGHYVGTLLLSQGKTYTEFTEFFEGDDSTVIDGKMSIHGTGSEDYFNGGWYAQPGGWVERLGTTLHGCLDYSLPYSRTGGYRFYISDKLPFATSIYHSIEHGPKHNNRAVDYRSLAFYYADRAIQPTTVPTNATARIVIPDTVTFYARLMNHLTYEGKMHLKDGNAVLEASQEGTTKVDLRELSSGRYALYLNLVATDNSDSEVSVQTGGGNSPAWKKLVAGKRIKNNFYYTGDVTVSDVTKPLVLRFRANGEKVVLHRVMLVKQP